MGQFYFGDYRPRRVNFQSALTLKGIEPSRITAEHAGEIMQKCSRAFMTLTDERNIWLAKEFFSILIHNEHVPKHTAEHA
ncbi:MAG: hypothetical protein IRZ28_17545 [Steroidobacteraceae bacterium]|nr:hypothetical protein [Steroidobacteraceae bacterium]